MIYSKVLNLAVQLEPRHSCKADTALAAGLSKHYIQVVRLEYGVAFRYLLTYLQHAVVPVSTLPGRAHLRLADSGQYDVLHVSSLVGSRAFSVDRPQA